MNVTCGECQSVFRVDPAKVPAGGVRARCSVCGAVMQVAGAHAKMVGAGAGLGNGAGSAADPAPGYGGGGNTDSGESWVAEVPQAIQESDAASAPEYYESPPAIAPPRAPTPAAQIPA